MRGNLRARCINQRLWRQRGRVERCAGYDSGERWRHSGRLLQQFIIELILDFVLLELQLVCLLILWSNP